MPPLVIPATSRNHVSGLVRFELWVLEKYGHVPYDEALEHISGEVYWTTLTDNVLDTYANGPLLIDPQPMGSEVGGHNTAYAIYQRQEGQAVMVGWWLDDDEGHAAHVGACNVPFTGHQIASSATVGEYDPGMSYVAEVRRYLADKRFAQW